MYVSVGVWVYPLLGLFSRGGLVGLFLFNMSVVTVLYLLGERLNCGVWGTVSHMTQPPHNTTHKLTP